MVVDLLGQLDTSVDKRAVWSELFEEKNKIKESINR